MNRLFALFLITAMILGIAVGLAAHEWLSEPQVASLAGGMGLITTMFLRLIKMIIAPLVFTTLVAGIAHMEGAAAIGRVGAKTIAWFVLASVVSLSLGLVMVHLFEPGVGLALPKEAGVGDLSTTLSLSDFITHLVPRSIVEAMADNEILQIVVFSAFAGTAIAGMKDEVPAVVALVEQVARIMLKITGYVMLLAPVAVFAALTVTVAQQGVGILDVYATFIGAFYLALGLLWLLLLAVAFVVRRDNAVFGAVKDPVLLAFSTASSEAAYPQLLDRLEGIGLPRRIVSFVLPLGYSFNLDGSMMYCTFAVLFIAQAYGIDLSIAQQVTLLLLLMVTSKGMAGVPRASLVVIAAALPYFHLPEAGLLLILAVDHILDMGRSATNIVGNAVACVVVNAWEGKNA
ncbi:MAG: dicarboxylate/amino acid:cation symporter [Alphaproteobacteria bacterium]|nr:dicarboxylate/amino acid:cation symporter [Alphaproteobacteria bacterium]